MYYLNKDGTIDNGSEKFVENPIEIVSVCENEITGEVESQYNLVEPHVNNCNCKCMKCFIKNKVGSKVTYNNALLVIVFLIFMYLIYLVLLRLFY
jgi:hypothetical protein